MNYRRLALVLALTSALSAPAHAASVVMLQFGSFETMEEAQARLAEVKAKHADILNGIEINVREVKLPPDNLTVYRTQAGPVPTRTAAQSACAKLAGSGDECYVVESAMLTPPASPAPAAVASAAAPASAPAPAPAPTPSTSLSSTTSGPATIRIPTLSPSGPLGSNAPAPAPAVPSVADAASVPAPAPSALPPLPPASPATPAANLATTASTPSLPIPPDAAALPIAPSPEMQMAMDHAVANQQAAETEAATTNTASSANSSTPTPDANAPANNGARHRSFWSRVNPFGSSSGEMPTRPPVLPSDTETPVIAAPSSNVQATPLMPPAPQPMPAIAAQSAPVQPQPIMAPLTPPAPVEPMHLPPPPAPLISSNSDIFNTPTTMPAPIAPMPPAPMIQAQPLPPQALPPQPLMPQPVFPSFPARPPVPQASAQITPFKPFPSVPAGGGEIVAANQGNITVEEARRVPLTESTAAPLMPMAVQPPVVLYPSATIGQKTLWAQIGQFRDTQSALAFWDSYRQMHPDFPVVRVRVVASFRQGADGPVSLRVGPFARQAFINSLCFTLADQENLRCGSSMDLGIAATMRNTPGYLPGSRYNRQ